MRLARTVLAAAVLFAGGAALAQTSLFLPNNSAGSVLDTPPLITQEPASPRTADTPKRTEPDVINRQQLDTAEREPQTREDVVDPQRRDDAAPSSVGQEPQPN